MIYTLKNSSLNQIEMDNLQNKFSYLIEKRNLLKLQPLVSFSSKMIIILYKLFLKHGSASLFLNDFHRKILSQQFSHFGRGCQI